MALKIHTRWFLSQFKPFLAAHFLSVSLIVLSSLMYLLDPLLLKWLIDGILPKKDLRLLLYVAAAFFAIYLFRLGFSALAELVSFRTVQKLAFRIRLGMLEQMHRLSAEFHESTPVGEKLYRMEQDVDQAAELGSSLVPYVLQTAFNTLFVLITLFSLDFRLTCMVLPLTPFFFIFRRYFEERLKQASELVQQRSSKENSFLQEQLSSIVQIQLLNQERTQAEAYLKRAIAKVKALNDRNLIEILFTTCYVGVIALGTIAILGYGGYRVFVGALTVGGLVAFYSYMARLFDPLHAAVDIYARLNRLGTNIRRIQEVIALVPKVYDRPGALGFSSPVRGSVEMENVHFSYGNRKATLEGLNLKLEAGEKVALVGVSGSGKSTIAKLIARLYDVNRGCVYIDGIDIRNVSLESLRAKVCYLMQDAVLFDRTLKENLILANPSASNEQLGRAIEIAGLEDLLRKLPAGLETPLGPRGNLLSGGERQRVALARAVLQKASVLIFDESSSALDAATERRIFANLAQHFRRETCILISHRISALRWVDRIVVLEQGGIQEQGTHDQLIQRGGPYAHMWNPDAAEESVAIPEEPPYYWAQSRLPLLDSD